MSTPPDDGDGPHLVFSYGTLQQSAVQASVFGGPVVTTPDAVVGHHLVPVRITDPAVVELSSSDMHTGLVASTGAGEGADRVEGSVMALTGAQLAAADAYESAYVRSSVPLASGRSAWAYMPAPTALDGTAGRALEGERDAGARRVAMVVSGLGSVGSALLQLVRQRAEQVRAGHGVDVVVVAVVDSRGSAVAPDGLDLAQVVAVKARGASVGELVGVGVSGAGVEQALARLDALGRPAQVLVEAGPADLVDGGAGLAAVVAARARGLGVVLANKAPLVVGWEQVVGSDVQRRAGAQDPEPPVRFSACIGAALPTVDLARTVAVSATITRVEVVLNSTCQRVLGEMEGGLSVTEAIAGAQAAGLAEADPSLDVDGTDTAVKLVILSAALGHRVPLAAVEVTGIRGVTPEQVSKAGEQGRVMVLLGTAEPQEQASEAVPSGWRLVVAPVALAREHPLARMDRHETGLVVHTDVAGRIAASGHHSDVTATGAAVLRDVVLVADDLAQRALVSR